MPETTANRSDPPDSDRAQEEELDAEYQARIRSLMNRATELSDEVTASCDSSGADGVSPSQEAPIAPDAAQPPVDPTGGMPNPRSRATETSDQLRDLRHIANASARTAITAHAARRRRQIMAPVYVALPLSLLALIVSQWIVGDSDAVKIFVVTISVALIVMVVHCFRALRRLDATSSSTKESSDLPTDA